MALLELFLDFIFEVIFRRWSDGKRERRIQTAREEGRQKGYAEGYAAAKAENSDAVEEAGDPPSKSSNPPSKSVTWFFEREKKLIQTAREESRQKGYAEGYAAAKAENSDAVEEAGDPPSKSSNPPSSSSKILN